MFANCECSLVLESEMHNIHYLKRMESLLFAIPLRVRTIQGSSIVLTLKQLWIITNYGGSVQITGDIYAFNKMHYPGLTLFTSDKTSFLLLFLHSFSVSRTLHLPFLIYIYMLCSWCTLMFYSIATKTLSEWTQCNLSKIFESRRWISWNAMWMTHPRREMSHRWTKWYIHFGNVSMEFDLNCGLNQSSSFNYAKLKKKPFSSLINFKMKINSSKLLKWQLSWWNHPWFVSLVMNEH